MSDQERVRLAGWKLRFAFEKIRPFWDLLPDELTVKIMAVYNKQADPDELALTKADFVRMARENHDFIVASAWARLKAALS